MSKELENMSIEELIEANKKLHKQKTALEYQTLSLESQKQSLESELKGAQSQKQSLESELEQTQFQLSQLQRMLFGAKRERFIPAQDENQLSLPFDTEPEDEPEKEQQTITYVRKKQKRENHPGRLALPSHLPVEEIIIEPKEDTSEMKCIGKEVTEQLELVPSKLYIKRYIRPKYIKVQDKETQTCKGIIADLPVFPIEKGIAGSGLLAQIMIDKFVDHIPIYRQIQRFKREDVKISSSTINGWQESVCNLLEPLYESLKQQTLSAGYIQADESPIQVLDKTKKGKTHRGYHWVYHSPLQKSVLFDYRNGRSREGPNELLKNFKGYLQTDGYAVYDSFDKKEGITLLNCMAHARRYFEKALDYDQKKAEYAMGMFQKIYAIERKAKDDQLSPKERYDLRLEESLPLLNELGKWIADSYKTVLPKSPIGKAMAYCIPRWDFLLNFLKDGSLEIDNNGVENAIRPLALGRKNYLFAGSERGAQRAAMFYSFFGTCKKNNINPFDWLKHVLNIIPEYKVNRLHELLPQNTKM
ncbi:IS66 family transposase [Lentimicrobium sp. S6]|uniref:IS66 family transposase n=1 Tax=Lentimicrobium sp. S6 TaxID=2735872 RepID=UPI00155434FE|nr:IS66 family transposase [Lentimicrobium sp. S6]NPD48278.1 IS66 family transposase [Lentimicrobium sp. S6]